jgi:molybdopterin/thiamine biosynthesis adenylyltransferase
MTERYCRQSFLGDNSAAQIAHVVIGVAGLGGGGSHVVQQLSHLGFQRFVLFDADVVEDSNLNRLIGATVSDVKASASKLAVATRMIRGLQPDADVTGHGSRWQDAPEALRRCDIMFGCVDSFSERDQLESSCRRYLIPLIDIGLDINTVAPEPPVMGGQVILSMPGAPCMRCLGFITDKRLADEASRYGEAGPRPQVVFGNGILAAAAVAIAVDLVTDWTRRLRRVVYLECRGNEFVLQPHVRLRDAGIPAQCPHYPADDVGPPVLRPL